MDNSKVARFLLAHGV